MNAFPPVLQKIFIGLFLGALAVLLYGYFLGYELSIPWNVTTTAESQQISAHSFQKGPFSFDFFGTSYELAENFSAGAIQNDTIRNTFFLGIIFLGICIILAASTHLSHIWFIGISGLFIFLIINLRLQDVGLFGFADRSSIGVIVLLVGFLLPSYLFHAFYTRIHFTVRLGVLILVAALVVTFSQVHWMELQGQLITGSYFGLIIVSLLYLLIVAEENVFGILYLITRARGGTNNHIHFSIFSVIYLAFVGLYYGKKSGLMSLDLTYFDPYILLAISSVVSLWSLQFKKDIFDNILSVGHLRIIFAGLGIITFGFLGMAFFRGNDPVYEGMHYFIVYCHLGFGVMFFFYLLLNFVNPLANGLQVYKVAYKEQNFPYISAKLGGIAAVAAFFFLASKEPFLLFRSGQYNYLGAQIEQSGNIPLAQEYYQEGAIYGYDNHFSNYKMAYNLLRKKELEEATYRFKRATLRYPSAQSFINYSGALAMEGETTPSLVTLKNGLRQFPGKNQLMNNLGLIYLDLGEEAEALNYLGQTGGEDKWTAANQVNFWKIKPNPGGAEALESYSQGNLAVKTNILARQLLSETDIQLPFDSTYLYPAYPLHRLAYLINAAWFFQDQDMGPYIEKAAEVPVDENMYQSAKHAASVCNYLRGAVNKALLSHNILRTESRSGLQQEYLHELGLMALEQHALENALSFFEQAVESGSEKSQLAKTAALLELGKLDEAIQWSESMARQDSSWQQLATDLEALKNTASLSRSNQYTRLYYFYSEYSLPEMSVLLDDAEPAYLRSLWNKIAAELLLKGDYDALQDYKDLLSPHLSKENFEEYELLKSIQAGKPISNNHPLSKALATGPDSLRIKRLKAVSSQNALNVPITLAAVNALNALDENAAYDALVAAYNFNRYSPRIIKAYIAQCLQMNLVDYATSPLDRLAELLPQEEYFSYLEYVNERLKAIESADPW